jgi:hypothetical protein
MKAMETETKTPKKKTKAEIEEDYPIIKPADCPGALIKWIQKRDEKMLERIEEIIDNLFSQYFKKYINMIFGNRIAVIVLAIFVASLWGVVIFHIYK